MFEGDEYGPFGDRFRDNYRLMIQLGLSKGQVRTKPRSTGLTLPSVWGLVLGQAKALKEPALASPLPTLRTQGRARAKRKDNFP